MPDKPVTPVNVNAITLENAAKFVATAPVDELANWQHCPYEGCEYCNEVARLRDAKP